MLAGLAGCTSSARPRLNVCNWSNYVAPDTIPNFEREFGVAVRYGVFESNEEMLAKALGDPIVEVQPRQYDAQDYFLHGY